MRIYISGPVTGQEDTARQRFNQAAAELMVKFSMRKMPVSIIDPFRANACIFERFRETPSHDDYMATSMAMLALCDAIYMMEGWQNSEGCQQEYKYAMEHCYEVIYQVGLRK